MAKEKEMDFLTELEEVIIEQEGKLKPIDSVSFLKICMKCEEFLDGEISELSFNRYLEKYVKVKPYLPLRIKKVIIDSMHIGMNGVDDFSDLTYLFELYSILHILMFYTNIEIKPDEITEDAYDLMIESGLADFVREKCKKDYVLTYKMAMNSFTFMTYEVINNFASAIDIDTAKTLLKDTQTALSETDIDKLQMIKDIIDLNDPSLADLRKKVYDETVKVVETMEKNEE